MRIRSMQCVCVSILAAAGMAVVLPGCSSSNSSTAAVERRENTVSSIGDMRSELIKADAQVVATQQSLDIFTMQQAGNLKKNFEQFKSNVDRTESMSNKINDKGGSLSTESYAHINEWNYKARTIQDPKLRERSLEREDMAKTEHDKMVALLNDVRGFYSSYIRQLRDIEASAATDLSSGGVAGLKEEADKARETGQQLRQKMAVLDTQLNKTAQAWRTEVPLAERVQEGGAQPAGGVIPANQPVDSTHVK